MGNEKAAPVGSRAAVWYQRLLNTNFEESGSKIVTTFGPEIKENPDAAEADYTQRSTDEDCPPFSFGAAATDYSTNYRGQKPKLQP